MGVRTHIRTEGSFGQAIDHEERMAAVLAARRVAEPYSAYLAHDPGVSAMDAAVVVAVLTRDAVSRATTVRATEAQDILAAVEVFEAAYAKEQETR